ncbi:GMC family oxidoreductase N-terminal domain-containing protein [Streptomyces sp. NPDC001027]|uniref:GMC family oxidoreductase n=1 Tax=Streptomyces sp. NPDC001027 TaxID=3154771 RepID=UPI003318FBBB
MSEHEFDYVIVGSGAAGSVMAERLTADGRNSVLVLEAGGRNIRLVTQVPKSFFFTAYTPGVSKHFTKSFPTEELHPGFREHWTRGRMTGGSTEINGMVWNRGWKEDYDAIEAAGNPGWNWEVFLDAFKRLEDHELGANELRGSGGPIHISRARPDDPTVGLFFQAAGSLGIPTVDDPNGSDDERVAYTASNIRHGFRVGADRAFLRPARRRSNLTIITHADVDKVILEGRRAVGVSARTKNGTVEFRARREVLLAAGALDSPLVLERSGIGDPKILTRAGVPVQVESPKVGQNLSEHRGMNVVYDIADTPSFNGQVNTRFKQFLTGAKYLFTRRGIISFGGYNALGYFKSTPDQPRPDIFAMFVAMSLHPQKTFFPNDDPGLMLLMMPMRPSSRGSIHITSPDPASPPELITGFLSTEKDRATLANGVRRARQVLAAAPLGKYLVRETFPGERVQDDETLIDLTRQYGATGYHSLGTCAMGPGDDDVVDADLRVRGVEGLRVIDASVFPHLTSANNNAATMAAALIIADRILAGK